MAPAWPREAAKGHPGGPNRRPGGVFLEILRTHLRSLTPPHLPPPYFPRRVCTKARATHSLVAWTCSGPMFGHICVSTGAGGGGDWRSAHSMPASPTHRNAAAGRGLLAESASANPPSCQKRSCPHERERRPFEQRRAPRLGV
eukprot:3542317-Pyramimonas_sp.AAC.2